MDSFGKMESMDDIKLSSPSKGSPPTATPKQRSPVTKVTILPKETAFVTEKGSGVPFSDGDHSVTSPTGLPKVLEADEHDERDEDDEEVLEEKRSSPYSLAKISHKMRESMKNAQDGHVSMDTSFVESILRDLDETKERMKDLQTKYDRIRVSVPVWWGALRVPDEADLDFTPRAFVSLTAC